MHSLRNAQHIVTSRADGWFGLVILEFTLCAMLSGKILYIVHMLQIEVYATTMYWKYYVLWYSSH